MPRILALALLILNGRVAWVGERLKNGPLALVALLLTLAFFAFVFARTFLAALA